MFEMCEGSYVRTTVAHQRPRESRDSRPPGGLRFRRSASVAQWIGHASSPVPRVAGVVAVALFSQRNLVAVPTLSASVLTAPYTTGCPATVEQVPFWEVHLAQPPAGLPTGATEQDFMMLATGAPPKEALVQAVLLTCCTPRPRCRTAPAGCSGPRRTNCPSRRSRDWPPWSRRSPEGSSW